MMIFKAKGDKDVYLNPHRVRYVEPLKSGSRIYFDEVQYIDVELPAADVAERLGI
jgi:hypothetical protein